MGRQTPPDDRANLTPSAPTTLSCPRIRPSLTNSAPRASRSMRDGLSKLPLPVFRPLPEGNVCTPSRPEASTLLQRMGLGNQTLMVRLGVPLKLPSNPTQTTCSRFNRVLDNRVICSNELVKKKGLSEASMLGTGINQGEVCLGKMPTQTYPPQTRLTSSVMPMPLISSGPSKALRHNATFPPSHQCSGEMSLRTAKSTLAHSSKTGILKTSLMTTQLTLEMGSDSRPKSLPSPKRKSPTTHSGCMPGQSTGKLLLGHSPTEWTSCQPMKNISLDGSTLISTPCFASSTTKWHKSSSIPTNSPSLKPASSATSPKKSSSHTQEEGGLVAPRLSSLEAPIQARLEGGKESILGVTLTPRSAENSTSHPGADGPIVSITTNAPTATQAATPNSNAPEKGKRNVGSKDPEYEHRGKRPHYMHFIFGKNDIGRTPSATYTKSSPPIPPVPASDY